MSLKSIIIESPIKAKNPIVVITASFSIGIGFLLIASTASITSLLPSRAGKGIRFVAPTATLIYPVNISLVQSV